MNLFSTIVLYGVPCSLILSAVILAMALRNPRFLLQDYPRDIRAAAPPKTPAERRASACWAALFFLVLLGFPIAAALSNKVAQEDFLSVFLSAFGVAFLFNIVERLPPPLHSQPSNPMRFSMPSNDTAAPMSWACLSCIQP